MKKKAKKSFFEILCISKRSQIFIVWIIFHEPIQVNKSTTTTSRRRKNLIQTKKKRDFLFLFSTKKDKIELKWDVNFWENKKEFNLKSQKQIYIFLFQQQKILLLNVQQLTIKIIIIFFFRQISFSFSQKIQPHKLGNFFFSLF